MSSGAGSEYFVLLFIIVNSGMGSRVLRAMKVHGVRGGTVLLGQGTVRNRILKFFSLYEERKEIVLIGADCDTATKAMEKVARKYHFDRPNTGIAFTTRIGQIVGSARYARPADQETQGEQEMAHQLIITIVDKGKAEDVVDAATASGAKGGTIVNARGSGIHETSRLFLMDIEPEKEMVIILSPKDITQDIVQSIREKLDLDRPGNGIAFVQDIESAYGVLD